MTSDRNRWRSRPSFTLLLVVAAIVVLLGREQDAAGQGAIERLPAVADEISVTDLDAAQTPQYSIVPQVAIEPPRADDHLERLQSTDSEDGSISSTTAAALPVTGIERQADDFDKLVAKPVVTEGDRLNLLKLYEEQQDTPSSPSGLGNGPVRITARELEGLRLPQEVVGQAERLTENGMRLASSGAIYSARDELINSLRLVAQGLDAQLGRKVHSYALAAGLNAISEAEDFSMVHGDASADVHLAGYVAGHTTPVLKGKSLLDVPPLLAMQKYYEFAHVQLSLAGGQEPVASRALYALGKVEQAIGNSGGGSKKIELGPKAIALYQSSLSINGNNAEAANELGVLLAQHGQLKAARAALQHTVSVASKPEYWSNLAEVHRQLGEDQLAMQATRQVTGTRAAGANVMMTQNTATRRLPPVQWMDPEMFARTYQPTLATDYRAIAPPSSRVASQPGTGPWASAVAR
ncbi:MAG: tetratricopeptide repeat protein [Pirellulaceae bacterium]|nr:tetratricopeptide repeat protein [Planctomycetales bacterium]